MTSPKDNPPDEKKPWWSPNAPEDTALPDGFPDRPDADKLDALQDQLRQDREERLSRQQNNRASKYAAKVGKSAKDIGTYTLIPAMMIAGPAVGYGLGWLVERQWGGAPWPAVIGLLFGLVAAFRQIFIILALKARTDEGPKK